VILTISNIRRIPWSPQLQAYVTSHFSRIYRYPGNFTVYVRKGMRGG